MKPKIYSVTLTGVFIILSICPQMLEASRIPRPLLKDPEHENFFKTLSEAEQSWLMKLSCWYEADPFLGVEPWKKNEVKKEGSLVGVPLRDPESESSVPPGLVLHFLNGDIPKKWQKEFVKWLKTEYNLKPINFQQFREEGKFCKEGDSCDLVDLTNIGGTCCPFG